MPLFTFHVADIHVPALSGNTATAPAGPPPGFCGQRDGGKLPGEKWPGSLHPIEPVIKWFFEALQWVCVCGLFPASLLYVVRTRVCFPIRSLHRSMPEIWPGSSFINDLLHAQGCLYIFIYFLWVVCF